MRKKKFQNGFLPRMVVTYPSQHGGHDLHVVMVMFLQNIHLQSIQDDIMFLHEAIINLKQSRNKIVAEDFLKIYFFLVIIVIFKYLICLPASVAQLDAPSDWRPGRGFNPRRGRQHSFVEINHEIFSTVILSLPLIQEGQLSVSGERMCTILFNCLED